MGEIEEDVANKGLPALFASGSDGCCKENEIDGFNCDWEIEPILLPDNMFPNQAQDQKLGAPGSSTSGTPASGAASGSPLSAALGAATSAAGAATQPGANPLDAVKNMDPAQMLAGGGLGGGLGGIAAIALSFAYPVLKPSFEGQIRRATVTVRWKEGNLEHKFDVTQYLVADQPLPLTVDPNTGQPLPGQPQPGQQPGALGIPGQQPPGLTMPGAVPGRIGL
jgi:hypothetical protein